MHFLQRCTVNVVAAFMRSCHALGSDALELQMIDSTAINIKKAKFILFRAHLLPMKTKGGFLPILTSVTKCC